MRLRCVKYCRRADRDSVSLVLIRLTNSDCDFRCPLIRLRNGSQLDVTVDLRVHESERVQRRRGRVYGVSQRRTSSGDILSAGTMVMAERIDGSYQAELVATTAIPAHAARDD